MKLDGPELRMDFEKERGFRITFLTYRQGPETCVWQIRKGTPSGTFTPRLGSYISYF